MIECALCLQEIKPEEDKTTLKEAGIVDSDDIVHNTCAIEFGADIVELERLFNQQEDI